MLKVSGARVGRRAMMSSRKWIPAAFLLCGLMFVPFAANAQTLAQLMDGAKKEGQLVLSWGTGTMGGIEGAQAMEKAFNKKYVFFIPALKLQPGPGHPDVPQPYHSGRESRPAGEQRSFHWLGKSRGAH